MIEASTVKDMVLKLRHRGLTQVQVAEQIGASQATVSRWERGMFSGQADSLARLIQLAKEHDLPVAP